MTNQHENPPSDGDRLEFTVSEDDSGVRLDKWLSERAGDLSRSRVKSLIDNGSLLRDGTIFTDPSWRLRAGESYRLEAPAVASPKPEGEDIHLEIAYEDEDLIVIDKPAGMVVHPGAGNWSGTLVNALIHHCGASLSGIGGVARPGIVHRIDKDTSGLLVVAKNDATHRGLAKAFAAHDIDREYLAICTGVLRPLIGTIDAPLNRMSGDRKKMAVVKPNPYDVDDENNEPGAPLTGDRRRTRHAITHYKVLDVYGRRLARLAGDGLACLTECRLETGRTHQIRVHMSHVGHPLIGDQTYGRGGSGLPGLKPGSSVRDHAIDLLGRFRRQALHAAVLGFRHPRSGISVRLSSEPPSDFRILIAALSAL